MIIVWLAGLYLAAYSLFYLFDFAVKQVRGWRVQREINRIPQMGFTSGWTREKDREERARRAALTVVPRQRL